GDDTQDRRHNDEQPCLARKLLREASYRRANGHPNAELSLPATRARQNEQADIAHRYDGEQQRAAEKQPNLATRLALDADIANDALDDVEAHLFAADNETRGQRLAFDVESRVELVFDRRNACAVPSPCEPAHSSGDRLPF